MRATEEKIHKSNKKPWTSDEDEKLCRLVELKGMTWKWSKIADKLNMNRTGKQCRERYNNHLRPEIVKGNWTREEDQTIIKMKELYGNQWTRIACFLPGRSDNSIKNRWHLIERSRAAGSNIDLYSKSKRQTASSPAATSNRSPTTTGFSFNNLYLAPFESPIEQSNKPISPRSYQNLFLNSENQPTTPRMKRCHSLLSEENILKSVASFTVLPFDVIESSKDWAEISYPNGSTSPTTSEETGWMDELLNQDDALALTSTIPFFNNNNNMMTIPVEDLKPGFFQNNLPYKKMRTA